MMNFRIGDTFTDSLANPIGDEHKAVKTIAFDLQLNPANLSGVDFVDAQGLTLPHRLQDQGVVLQTPSPFVQELLNTSLEAVAMRPEDSGDLITGHDHPAASQAA